MSVWKSDETLLSICILNFSFKNDFVWEEISNIRHSVSSPDETPRSSSKILRCASYFQLSSRCFIWWWNTASHVWYITSSTLHFSLIKENFQLNSVVAEPLNVMKDKINKVYFALAWEIRWVCKFLTNWPALHVQIMPKDNAKVRFTWSTTQMTILRILWYSLKWPIPLKKSFKETP